MFITQLKLPQCTHIVRSLVTRAYHFPARTLCYSALENSRRYVHDEIGCKNFAMFCSEACNESPAQVSFAGYYRGPLCFAEKIIYI